MHYAELGRIITYRRKMLGITQAYLAELAGVGLRTLKSIEKGTANPTFESITKLAEVLGMELKLEVKKTE